MDGTVTTLCGSHGEKGTTAGKGSDARFYHPSGITSSLDGTLFVTDTYNHTIRKITSDGTVTTLCGSHREHERTSTDGNGSNATFAEPYGIVFKCTMKWSPKTHWMFPPVAKSRVMTVLMMSAMKSDGTPWHPESLLYFLPKDILYLILQWSISEVS